jgi:hypothetical protein
LKHGRKGGKKEGGPEGRRARKEGGPEGRMARRRKKDEWTDGTDGRKEEGVSLSSVLLQYLFWVKHVVQNDHFRGNIRL